MRVFQRYTSDIPIHIVGEQVTSNQSQPLYNVSYGGLACSSDIEFHPGELIKVRIARVEPQFEGVGVVVWCDPTEVGYEVGIQFQEGRDAFAARMVEQICQIEAYRQKVLETEGRELSSNEAGLEWIAQNAHKQAMQEREFIRHPTGIPIEISGHEYFETSGASLRDFSMKGACFHSETPINVGEFINIQLPKLNELSAFNAEGVVVWCSSNGTSFEVGVEFRQQDEIFFSEMFKQISQIENFKQELYRTQGRKLSGEEAVNEFAMFQSQQKDAT